MAMIAFRADAELDRRLQESAAKQKKTKTEIIREALEVYLNDRSPVPQGANRAANTGTREALQDFIGIWDGPREASIRAGKTAGDHLFEKRRTRRM